MDVFRRKQHRRDHDMRQPLQEASSLRRSIPARYLKAVYSWLACDRRWTIGRFIMGLILRLEGGAMHSATARDILLESHGVAIGAYSYGPCFTPGIFPPDVVIGRYTSIAEGVRVVNENHPLDSLSTHPFFYTEGKGRKTLTIGHDVWIGYNAVILPGCSNVGHGAVIGAGSIVTHDVPPYAVVAGNPARILRFRFPQEEIDRLLQLQWWNAPTGPVHHGAHAAAKA